MEQRLARWSARTRQALLAARAPDRTALAAAQYRRLAVDNGIGGDEPHTLGHKKLILIPQAGSKHLAGATPADVKRRSLQPKRET
jgi:hypothetical protein